MYLKIVDIMKLMIVDDNPDIRKILKSICFNLFDEIIECSDGDEAIESYLTNNPEWTLMDIKMKRIDGLTAASEITSRNPLAKIIMISQYSDELIVEASRSSGAIEFVNKENLLKIKEIITSNEY